MTIIETGKEKSVVEINGIKGVVNNRIIENTEGIENEN